MPLLLAVVAEERLTARSLALELRAAGTAARNDAVVAVRCGTPACIRVGDENASYHKGLVLVNQIEVISEDNLDVIGVKLLGTLRTGNVDARFKDFNAQILP